MLRPVPRPLLLAPVLALALLTGCSGGGSSDSGASTSAAAADSSGGKAAAAAPAVAPAGTTGKAQQPLAGRSLVRTAEVTVQVPDVRAAADRAGEVARTAGGVVVGEESGEEEPGGEGPDGGPGAARADLQLKVPPARLDETLSRLARLGRERSRTVSTDDVTEQVVDLDSRLATQRASVARVRALLDRATGLGDVVRIEGELARREADLESLDARARALGARVDLATLTVHLVQADEVAVASAPGFGRGLDAGWGAFTASARVLSAVAGALLPFLPLLLLAGLAVRWRSRRSA